MNVASVLVSCLTLIGVASAAVAGQKDRMKFAFNMPPEFSHKRDRIAPQNVDIIETVAPTKADIHATNTHLGTNFAVGQHTSIQNNIVPGAGIPIKVTSMASNSGLDPINKNQESKIFQLNGPNSSNSKFMAGKPQVIASPVSNVFPRQSGQDKAANQPINDRMVNRMMQNPALNIQSPTKTKKNNGCNFNLPNFLLPDMNTTQVEFDQKYLLPALKAHLTTKACRSRALTVYIDWLLYVRLREFNV